MKGNWDSQPDTNQAERIMRRAVELCPALTGGKGIEHLSIIRHGGKYRPRYLICLPFPPPLSAGRLNYCKPRR